MRRPVSCKASSYMNKFVLPILILPLFSFNSVSQAIEIIGCYTSGHGAGSISIELKDDSTFQKIVPGSWDSSKKVRLSNTKWKVINNDIILEWGLFTKKSDRYTIQYYQKNTFLIPIDEIDDFNDLIKNESENNEEKVIKNEMIMSYLHKE